MGKNTIYRKLRKLEVLRGFGNRTVFRLSRLIDGMLRLGSNGLIDYKGKEVIDINVVDDRTLVFDFGEGVEGLRLVVE